MALTCDIFAHKVINGKRTNEISDLHVNLLKLGGIVKSFDRRRANKAFHLSNSLEFKNTHSLIYDPGGEVNMVSLYEEAREMFPDVTFDNMRTFMNDVRHPWINVVGIGFKEALEKVIRFNKAYKGSRTFMATLRPDDEGKYKVEIVFNTEENQLELINMVSDMNTLKTIVERLNSIGGRALHTHLDSELIFKNPSSSLGGILGVIKINEDEDPAIQQKELADNTGIFISRLIAFDNPFIERLIKVIEKTPAAIRDMLGEDVYDKYLHDKIDVKEVIGLMIGYYLRHYDAIRPKGVLGNIAYLVGKVLDWFKKTFSFITRQLYLKASYEAKYTAFTLAKEFMGDNFKAQYDLTVNGTRLEVLPVEETFNELRNQLKQFDNLLNSIKDVDANLFNSYRNEFLRYLDKLNKVATLYSNERHLNLGEELLIGDVEKDSRQALALLCKFLTTQIEKGQAALANALYEKNPDGSELTMLQHAKIVKFNTEIHNFAILLIKGITPLVQGNPTMDNLQSASEQLVKVTSASTVYSLAVNSIHEGNEIVTNLVETTLSYEAAILQCRRGLAMRFLTQINGGRFVNLEKHVTIDDRHWYRVRRHASKNIDLWRELIETDINPPYQWISRLIDSMADNPDIINQMIYNSVEEERHKANVKTLELREKLRNLHDIALRIRWRDSHGKMHTGINYKMLYERYNDKVDKYGDPVLDKSGKTKDGEGLTGNFISERNWGEWEREKKRFLLNWEDDFYESSIEYVLDANFDSPNIDSATGKVLGTPFKYMDTFTYKGVTYVFGNTEKQRAEYRKYFKKFVLENATIVSKQFYSKSDMVNTAGYLEAYIRVKRQWHLENSVRIPLTDAKGNLVLDDKGNPKKVWAPVTTADLKSSLSEKRNVYDSKQFEVIQDDDNVDLRNWYYSYMRLKRELDTLIPTGGTNPFGLSAPLFNGTFTNRIKNAVTGDNKGSVLGMTLSNIISQNVSALRPGEIEFGTLRDTYDEDEVVKTKDGSLIYGRAHSNTLSFEERIPVYGVRKLRNIADLSTDIMHSTLAYASMAYNYSCLNEVVGSIEATALALADRKVGFVEKTVNELKKAGEDPGTYNRLEDYIKHLIFNDFSKHNGDYSFIQAGQRKLINQLVKLSSWWFLKGNWHSAITNAVTGMVEIFKEATAHTNFNRRTVLRAMIVYAGWFAASRLIRLGNSLGLAKFNRKFTKAEKLHGSTNEDYMKLTLFLRHFNVLNDNLRDFILEHLNTPGYQLFNHFSYMQFTMLPYTITDEWMLAIPYMASAMFLKLRNKNDHSKTKSLWDLYGTRNGKLVCSDGEFEDWEIENTNAKEVKKLIAKKTLDGTHLENASFEEIEFYKDPTNEWDTWDLKRENLFRLKCRGCNNRLHGIYNTGDGGALIGMAFGPLLLSLKKYAIGLIDRRFSRARYDFRLRKMRQGSTTTLADLAVDLIFNAGSYQEDENGNVSFGVISGLDSHKWLDTTIGVRQAFGLVTFASLLVASIFRHTPRGYLKKRGYSDEQINNVNRAVHDTVAIFCMRALLTICWPPEDEEKEELKKIDADIDKLWFPGRVMLKLYSAELRLLAKARRMTLDDKNMITPEGIAKRVKSQTGVLPFTAGGITFFQTYRALREQWAYNFLGSLNLWNGFKSGMAPELRSLSDSFVPAISGGIDFCTTISKIIGMYVGEVTPEEINEMKEKKDDDYKKYDNIYIDALNKLITNTDTKNPYGAEVYIRGENKDWYKGSMGFVKTCSYTRTLRTWCNGYSSAYNNEFANRSELLEYAKLQGWGWMEDVANYVGSYTIDLVNGTKSSRVNEPRKMTEKELEELDALY